MSWTPPANTIPQDRKPPSVATRTDVEPMLDWLRGYNSAKTALGLEVFVRDTQKSYKVKTEGAYIPYNLNGPHGIYGLSETTSAETVAVTTQVATTAAEPLADTHGPRTIAGVQAAITAKAGQLAAADYTIDSTTLILDPANPLKGRGRINTRFLTVVGTTPPGPIVMQMATGTDSDPKKPQAGLILEGLTIADEGQVGGSGIGLLWHGSHRVVREVSIRGFYGGGSAIQFSSQDTYCATLENFELFDGSFGLTFTATPTNSGERMAFNHGSIFNLQTLVRVLDEGWLIKFHDVSFDYPSVSAFAAGRPMNLNLHQCHLEWSAPGQPFLPLVSPALSNTDAGVITITDSDLVHFMTPATTFNDLVGGSMQKGTIIFRDCLLTWVVGGAVKRQRINKALTHHQPFGGGTTATANTVYQNDTAATLRVRLHVVLPAGGAWAAYIGDTSGCGIIVTFLQAQSGTGQDDHTVSFDVPPGYYYKVSGNADIYTSGFVP